MADSILIAPALGPNANAAASGHEPPPNTTGGSTSADPRKPTPRITPNERKRLTPTRNTPLKGRL